MIVRTRPCCDGDERVLLSMTRTEAEMVREELRYAPRGKVTDHAFRKLVAVTESRPKKVSQGGGQS